ncbi:hypothetical protein QFZ29_003010 [Agromyces albus]|nr:hypothetical protein [Agromyces albus]
MSADTADMTRYPLHFNPMGDGEGPGGERHPAPHFSRAGYSAGAVPSISTRNTSVCAPSSCAAASVP